MLALVIFTIVIILGVTIKQVIKHHVHVLSTQVEEGCSQMANDIDADLAILKTLGLID